MVYKPFPTSILADLPPTQLETLFILFHYVLEYVRPSCNMGKTGL
jgi:hypothetical protein